MRNRLEQPVKQRANTTVSDKMTRIVVLGSSEVGKTTIVRQFLYRSFVKEHASTFSDLYRIQLDPNVTIEILDTGDYVVPNLRKMMIKTGHAFLLVYAMDNKESFDTVSSLREEIIAVHGEHVPIVVIGNKADTERKIHPVVTDCVVTIDWECKHVEVSAKEHVDIKKIFVDLLQKLAHNHERRVAALWKQFREDRSNSCPQVNMINHRRYRGNMTLKSRNAE